MTTKHAFHTAVLLLLSTGCYYGSLQGARTLGENRYRIGGGVGLPAYLSSDDRREADTSGEDNLPVSPSLSFFTGAARRMDLGLAAYGYGIGPQVRVALLDPGFRAAISVSACANYVIPAKVIGGRASLAAGYLLGRDLELYGAWDAGYGPDVINVPEDSTGARNWSEMKDSFYHYIRAGAVYALPGGGGSGSQWLPDGVTFEFAVPLDLRWNMVLAGLGVFFQ